MSCFRSESASFLMLRTLAEYLKTTRQQIEDYKIQGWGKTSLIASKEEVHVGKEIDEFSQSRDYE